MTQGSRPDAPEARVDFEAPPVNEVVFSVQFATDVVDEVFAVGVFRPLIEVDFPGLAKHPPLPPAREDFGPPSSPVPEIRMLEMPPTHRYWFVSGDGTRLLQLQGDRFILNWRQQDGATDYPRYESLRPEFQKQYTSLIGLLGGVDPEWCEISYINHIPARTGSGAAHGPLGKVLRALSPEPVSTVLPEVEDTQLQQRFVIRDATTEEPVGRFYLNATPAWKAADNEPVYVVTLLARGKPSTTDPEGVMSFMDLGHRLIVQGFKECTTDEMHRAWGLLSP